MSRDLRVHYGGTWEEIIIGTVRGNDYKGGIFRDNFGIHFEDVVSYQKLLEIVCKCFPEIDGRICSFYYMTGTVRLLVVSDDDLKFMWRNITPSNDGFTHLYYSPYCTVKAYRATYDENIKPIPHENEWEESTEIVLPPITSRMPGRPKHNRYKAQEEPDSQATRNQKKYGKCGGFGHNLRGCQGGPIANKAGKGGGGSVGVGRGKGTTGGGGNAGVGRGRGRGTGGGNAGGGRRRGRGTAGGNAGVGRGRGRGTGGGNAGVGRRRGTTGCGTTTITIPLPPPTRKTTPQMPQRKKLFRPPSQFYIP